jgi:translation initiation factor IF-2
MTAVEWLIEEIHKNICFIPVHIQEQAKEMEKQEKIKILKSLVYSVCIGDDVEDVEEWLKEHELNKSE